jgi:beta-glucanase (GH16 family)
MACNMDDAKIHFLWVIKYLLTYSHSIHVILYSSWPSSGEIDLMESRGNSKIFDGDVNVGVEHTASTIHYGPFFEIRRYLSFPNNTAPNEGFNKDFHLYQMEWTPEKFVFKVDDFVIGELPVPNGGWWEHFQGHAGVVNPWAGNEKMAPFDQEFYIIMNLAVGGVNGYFSDNLRNEGAPKPWSNTSPYAMKEFWEGKSNWLPTWKLDENFSAEASLQVDYVRVWAL